MRIFIDTNLLIDVALEREAFVDHSQAVLDWCSTQSAETWVSWHTITNCYYVLRSSPPKALGDESARLFLTDLLSWTGIAPATIQIARTGLAITGGDFEDHLQALCAEAVSADVIVTRNVDDFKGAKVRTITPSAFLQEVSSSE